MRRFKKRHPWVNTEVDPGQPNLEPTRKPFFLKSPNDFTFNAKIKSLIEQTSQKLFNFQNVARTYLAITFE